MEIYKNGVKIPKLYYTIGIPGSGKTTWAKAQDIPVFSSDDIRKELYGDASIQGNPDKVFGLLHERVRECLRNGQSCILDATNLTPRSRKVPNLPEHQKIAVIFNTPIDECKYRNENRDRVVPEEVIDRMAKKYIPPKREEGFRQAIYIEP